MTDLLLDTSSRRAARLRRDDPRERRAAAHVINDILDFSKIEAGKLELEHVDFDLRESSRRCSSCSRPRRRARGSSSSYEFDPASADRFVGDPGRLRQVLINLVGNAIKFTEHGEVVPSSCVAPSRDGRRRARGRVRGARHRHRHSAGGAGPPLPVVHAGRRLARRAGTAAPDSAWRSASAGRADGRRDRGRERAGQGLHVPLHRPRCARSVRPARAADGRTLRGLRVLVVDDNATNRSILGQLRGRGA